MAVIRNMKFDDIEAAERTWSTAFGAMRAAHGLPAENRTPESIARLHGRLAHVLSTDPSRSFVAEQDGVVVGLSQALQREGAWVLSLLAVAPECQQQHIGKDLLDAALATMTAEVGMIFSSPDARAMRRYTRAGFALHPSMFAGGRVQAGGLPEPTRVRPGSLADLGLVAQLDRAARRGSHEADLEYLFGEGGELMVIDDRGYALRRGGRPVFLAATDDDAAAELLAACLLCARPEEHVDVGWITAGQQWAIRTVLAAGLALRPMGPFMLKGLDHPPASYLPSGAYG